jgi:hypothetical protein
MGRHKPIDTGLKLLPMEIGASRSRSKTDRPTSWIMRTAIKWLCTILPIRRVHYPGLSGAQQSERPRTGMEDWWGWFNAASHSYGYQLRNGATPFQGAWPFSGELAWPAVHPRSLASEVACEARQGCKVRLTVHEIFLRGTRQKRRAPQLYSSHNQKLKCPSV